MADQKRLLVGGAVITVDGDRRVLDPGAVVVEGDRIAAVGDRGEIVDDHPDAERVDLEGTILVPGLVDSHGHAGHSLTKNLAGGTGRWLDLVADVYFRCADEEFWLADSYLAALEHLTFGVTTSLAFPGSMPRVDDPKFSEAAAEGFADLGLRHVVNPGPPSPPFPREYHDPETGESTHVDLAGAFETTEAVVERLDGSADGRISVSIGPSSLVPEIEGDGADRIADLAGSPGPAGEPTGEASELSVRQLERAVELRDEHGVPIQAHAYRGQIAAAADAVPEILSPALSLAHCSGISEGEIELMAEEGVHAAHSPMAHAYAMARFPVVEALEAGVNVAVSTDGAAPDRSFDLLSQGRIAAQLQRAHFNDPSVLPAGKVLEAMTIDAARALRLDDEVGSLEPGKKADVVAVDADTPAMRPRYQPVQRLVHYASGGDVRFVMVDGEALLRGGEYVRDVDPAGIMDRADEAAMAAIERAGALDATEPGNDGWGQVRYG